MAKFTEELPVELIRQFEELNLGATDMMKKMTEAGAKVVYTNVKSNLKKVLNRRTGDLEKSLIITRPYKNSKEEIATKVGFYGYDRNGIPNPLKAMAREYGTSNGEAKKPFLRPAFKKKTEIEQAMQSVQDEYLPKE
ncbi:MAG TPA: HK97 gp10 family phage protein [Candidatus Onthocola stercoravium]|nr:HK97 gp10 family phage protein [Candidatus Onthocola stercoravium]